MEDLARIREQRYKEHIAKLAEEERIIKKQKIKETIKERSFLYLRRLKKKYFVILKDFCLNPWDPHIEKIANSWFKWRAKNKITGNSVQTTQEAIFFGEDDDEIRKEILMNYEEGLKKDRETESIKLLPLVFWANTCLPELSQDQMLQAYFNKIISVRELKEKFSHCPQINLYLFWIKVHLSTITRKVPSWVRMSRDNVLEISQTEILNLNPIIMSFESRQCPHCNSRVKTSEMVDFDEYQICMMCNSLLMVPESMDNLGQCFVCSNYSEVKLYESIPVCETCARRQGIFQTNPEDRINCPGCGLSYLIEEMIIHPEGMYFCKDCGNIVGMNDENSNPSTPRSFRTNSTNGSPASES